MPPPPSAADEARLYDQVDDAGPGGDVQSALSALLWRGVTDQLGLASEDNSELPEPVSGMFGPGPL